MNLINFLRVNVLGWIARRDNPHQVTAHQAGAMTSNEIEDKLSEKMPVGVMPIYAYGTEDESPIGHTETGLNCSITLPQPLLLYGRPYTIAPATVTAMVNTTSYIVIELVGNIPQYKVMDIKPTDTNTRIAVGELTASNVAITKATVNKVRGIIAAPAPI